MITEDKASTDYMALLGGLTMLRSLVNDVLSGNEDLQTDALTFYSGFKLAADGFLGAAYESKTDYHKAIIKRELDKYIEEVREVISQQDANKILKFPPTKSDT